MFQNLHFRKFDSSGILITNVNNKDYILLLLLLDGGMSSLQHTNINT